MIKLKIVKETKKLFRNKDVLLICGDGKLLKEDICDFLSWNIPYDILCIGRSIQVVPGKVLHYADVDAEAGMWVAENLEKNNPDKINGKIFKHTIGSMRGFDIDWDFDNCSFDSEDVMWHGSSSYFAVLIGLEMGYKRIVLAGCPLDSKGHWYSQEEETGPIWTGDTYQVWFEFVKERRSKRVRSLSGYTKILLKTIDKDFLYGIC